MVRYRVQIALTFAGEVRARQVWQAIRDLVAEASPLPDDRIQVHRCYHDEAPARPCELLREWKPSP